MAKHASGRPTSNALSLHTIVRHELEKERWWHGPQNGQHESLKRPSNRHKPRQRLERLAQDQGDTAWKVSPKAFSHDITGFVLIT